LAVCLDNTAETYAEFEQFDSDCIDERVKSVFEKSLQKYKEVLPFEMALKNLSANEAKKLEEYKNYLDYELKCLRMKSPSMNAGNSGAGQKQKQARGAVGEQEASPAELEECRMRVKCLFERALADNQNCLDASLWLKYVYFLVRCFQCILISLSLFQFCLIFEMLIKKLKVMDKLWTAGLS